MNIDHYAPSKSPLDQWLDRLPVPIVRRAIRSFLPKLEAVRKSTRLVLALREEWRDRQLRKEFWDGVNVWSEYFYDTRNHHTHGGRTEIALSVVDPYERGVYEISLRLAEWLLFLRCFGDNSFVAEEKCDLLNELFIETPAVRRLVKTLRSNDRKVWFPGTQSIAAGSIEMFAQDLHDLVKLRRISSRFRRDKTIAEVQHKMGLTLSAWVEALNKNPPASVNLSPVANVPKLYRDLAARQPALTNAQIHDEVAGILNDVAASWKHSYGPSATTCAELRVRGIPIWQWVAAYIRLTELHKGFALSGAGPRH